ncbi:ABC transporter ATP-binding protein [Thermobispora bispora]|uniref:ABC transporter related protein n=1 Tax=Thermobispora bispora (strain ATCC 19993 / DSM 43833 / CBS 139.67 / JCM 10125 / KCTC 9307 / NBRC 14880 / R51) TaxID=469371 RepID=D6YA41_THEBD|nr:ABC transporter ATP-binding protein [Thermobispora bispora]MBO2474079.1 ABC transporter ATP-binding protein [Actinomycetales bacterium]MDI9581951.1 ABC transporter ATP-binding protein [Thermobispora sp.]ADG88184.1 ABC transporter related protein [Thermobispora bispora DSM 43833]MBX6166522.1 ABC transporter ATP-binding protein [Thermobispora bispora]QSI48026.1 ABC transporter ATP-binding protein [Thermobispora bispora]
MAETGLEVTGLHVRYGPVRALRGVSLAVPPGGVVAVLGANGAGKTTLLRAISGTLRFHGGRVTAGTVSFQGRALTGAEPAAVVGRGVVQVPEGRRVFTRMTVAENLRAGAIGARGRTDAAAARERVFELFPILAERAHQRAGLLSGGEQQMLAIGRALMARPAVLLLDEPTLGLAPAMAARIAETIKEINAQGTSVLLVEQNAALALSLASHAYVLEVGEVTLSGPAAELASSDEVRRRYLGEVGTPMTNRPVGTASAGAAGRRTLARWTE